MKKYTFEKDLATVGSANMVIRTMGGTPYIMYGAYEPEVGQVIGRELTSDDLDTAEWQLDALRRDVVFANHDDDGDTAIWAQDFYDEFSWFVEKVRQALT